MGSSVDNSQFKLRIRNLLVKLIDKSFERKNQVDSFQKRPYYLLRTILDLFRTMDHMHCEGETLANVIKLPELKLNPHSSFKLNVPHYQFDDHFEASHSISIKLPPLLKVVLQFLHHHGGNDV